MLSQPSLILPGPSVTINSFSGESLGSIPLKTSGAPASAVYPTANLAILVPFRITKLLVVTELFAFNGTVVSGNIDLGIYDNAGNKIVTIGSTAQSGTSVLQGVTITSQSLAPGLYYLAVAMDNTTGTLFSQTMTQLGFLKILGLAQMATAFPLPSTITFATVSNIYIPFIGLTTRSFL